MQKCYGSIDKCVEEAVRLRVLREEWRCNGDYDCVEKELRKLQHSASCNRRTYPGCEKKGYVFKKIEEELLNTAIKK